MNPFLEHLVLNTVSGHPLDILIILCNNGPKQKPACIMYKLKLKPSAVFCSSVGFFKPSDDDLYTYSGLVSVLGVSEQNTAFRKVFEF